MSDTAQENKTRKQIRKMTRQEEYAANKLLDQHCHKGIDGYVYDEGWNDERVGKEVSANLTLVTIQLLRNTMKGKLQPKTIPPVSRNAHAELVKHHELLVLSHQELLSSFHTLRNAHAELDKRHELLVLSYQELLSLFHTLRNKHNDLVDRIQRKVQLDAGWPNLKMMVGS